jgi:hypothetical protein
VCIALEHSAHGHPSSSLFQKKMTNSKGATTKEVGGGAHRLVGGVARRGDGVHVPPFVLREVRVDVGWWGFSCVG